MCSVLGERGFRNERTLNSHSTGRVGPFVIAKSKTSQHYSPVKRFSNSLFYNVSWQQNTLSDSDVLLQFPNSFLDPGGKLRGVMLAQQITFLTFLTSHHQLEKSKSLFLSLC